MLFGGEGWRGNRRAAVEEVESSGITEMQDILSEIPTESSIIQAQQQHQRRRKHKGFSQWPPFVVWR